MGVQVAPPTKGPRGRAPHSEHTINNFIFAELVPARQHLMTRRCGRLAKNLHVRRSNAKSWCVLRDRVGDVARCKVSVVFLDHARIGMAKVLGDHDKRHPAHDRKARPSVPQPVKRNWRINVRLLTSCFHAAILIAFLPLPPDKRGMSRSSRT